MKVFLFPGQGSQRAGMYSSLNKYEDEVKNVFDIAGRVTGRDVVDLCLSATDEVLKQTINTQLCVTTMNIAYAEVLKSKGIVPDVVAGHSLGQFSALAVAGVITYEDLFRVIKKRAELMDGLNESGKLAVIMGLRKSTVEDICKAITAEGYRVQIALDNSLSQVVVGGKEDAVDRAIVRTKESGAIKISEVRVSNAFHTYLMEPMIEPFKEFVDTIDFKESNVRVLLNAKGDYAANAEEIREDVIKQCVSEVKWTDCITKVLKEDPTFIEVGFGKTMMSLIKGTDRSKRVWLSSNEKDLDEFLSVAREG
ncbi:MAG: ACP S-malonyltransferase [Lachnospiraceae bacterium]|nr:ACP S-malonyltransferase [Lachnospiraceae bacterium]